MPLQAEAMLLHIVMYTTTKVPFFEKTKYIDIIVYFLLLIKKES